MMATGTQIQVTSHVGRDFLQSSAYFNSVAKIVWEYVSNSIDAEDEGVGISVLVEIGADNVRITDNGRGMTRDDLSNFFTMHGRNVLRQRGKRVRGRFGTGKSAAFGLANQLVVDTCRDRLRNCVSLHRRDIEAAADGAAFPVRDVVVNEPDDQPNGTVVVISEFNIQRLEHASVVAYIEKQLSRYRQNVIVVVNGHLCSFEEPVAIETHSIEVPSDLVTDIGDVVLNIKVSPTPLDEGTAGIDILSNGNIHETTLAGLERLDKANMIFGEIDVPLLEDNEWPIPPFDNTRNNTLNRQNSAVVKLLGWIAEEIEKVRTTLVAKEQERRRTQQARDLAKEAKKIARLLNEDFEKLEIQVEKVRRIKDQHGQLASYDSSENPSGIGPDIAGTSHSSWQSAGNPHGLGRRGQNPPADGSEPRPGPSLQSGADQGTERGGTGASEKRPRATFAIDFGNETVEKPRSRYVNESATIMINLDHPQVLNAYRAGGSKVDSRQFRDMAYEIAIVEYAIAVQTMHVEIEFGSDPSDVLYDLRMTISRLSRRVGEILADQS